MRKLIRVFLWLGLSGLLAAEIGVRGADALRGRGFFSTDRRRLLDGSLFTLPRLFCQYGSPPGARYAVPGSEIRINSLGLRGEEVSREKQSGVYRILCLGGSTTFDPYNGADLHWPLLLERKLRAAFPGREIEVLNAGTNGWSSAHSLTWFVFDGLALSPDLVIVYQGVNDLSVNFHGEPAPDYSNKYGLEEWDPRPERRLSALDRALGWSQAYLFLRLSARALLPAVRKVEVKDYDAARGLPAEIYFRRNLESICAVARVNGIRVAVGLHPQDILRRYDKTLVTQLGLGGSVTVPDPLTLLGFHRRYVEVAREAAARAGALVIDADRAMSGRSELFVDTCHTTAAGSEELAEVVKNALAPELFD